jgi:PAS domain S-box-containing protein
MLKFFNRGARDIIGYPEETLSSRPFIEFVHPEDRKIVLDRYLKKMAGESNLPVYPFRIIARGGKEKWVEAHAVFIQWNGKPATLNFLSDITMHREAEEEIRIQRERFKVLTENSPFGMLLIGKDGAFNYINPKFKEIFGYDLRDFSDGKKWSVKAYPDGGQGKEVLSSWIRDLSSRKIAKVIPRVFTVVCKDGTEKIIKFIPVLLEGGYDLMTCEDITDRKRAENTLIRQSEQLHDLSAKLSEAEETERKRISRELHDHVGQNLATLGLNLNILMSMIPAASADAVRNRIEDSLNLVQQTTQYTRNLMADLRPPVMDDYGLMASIRWYGESFSLRTGIEFIFRGEDILPRPKASTEVALFRIFQEALINVTKHAHARHVEIMGDVHDNRLKLVITDDGKGFDQKNLDKTHKHYGWGLTSMAERAESIGGSFTIETQPGQGTKITLDVPV